MNISDINSAEFKIVFGVAVHELTKLPIKTLIKRVPEGHLIRWKIDSIYFKLNSKTILTATGIKEGVSKLTSSDPDVFEVETNNPEHLIDLVLPQVDIKSLKEAVVQYKEKLLNDVLVLKEYSVSQEAPLNV